MTEKKEKKRSTTAEVVSREYTVHMRKLLFGRSFRKRAPHAIKSLKAFAQKQMGTSDVRIDPSLNHAVWSQGIKHVPHRMRVLLCRRRNEAEDAKEKLYTLVKHVPVTSYKGKLLQLNVC